MAGPGLHRLSTWGVIGLPLFCLALILSALGTPPAPDEGTKAHLFQLAVVLLVPAGLVYLATADWSKPLREVPPIVISAFLLVAAFAVLFRYEHPRI